MKHSERWLGNPYWRPDVPLEPMWTSPMRDTGSLLGRIKALFTSSPSTSTSPALPLSTHYLIVRHEEAIGLLRELVALLPEQRGVKANEALRRARRFVGVDDRAVEDIVRNLEEGLRNAQ